MGLARLVVSIMESMFTPVNCYGEVYSVQQHVLIETTHYKHGECFGETLCKLRTILSRNSAPNESTICWLIMTTLYTCFLKSLTKIRCKKLLVKPNSFERRRIDCWTHSNTVLVSCPARKRYNNNNNNNDFIRSTYTANLTWKFR